MDPLVVLYKLKQETVGNPVFQKAINRSIASRLIGIINSPLDNQKEMIRQYRVQAKKELWKLLPEILKESCGIKIKMQAVGAVVCPAVYREIHFIYSTVRGTRKKYEVK